MGIEIPEQLKADVPATMWGKVLTATPVIMTVLATMLAGLASSEMTRAQYDRALAAQQQSKAGDQWSFFQAKRLRGEMQENTLDLLRGLVEMRPFSSSSFTQSFAAAGGDPAAKASVLTLIASPQGRQTLTSLEEGRLPGQGPAFAPGPEVQAAITGIAELRPDAEVTELLSKIESQTLEDLLLRGKEASAALDAATGPVNRAVDQIDAFLVSIGGALSRDFTAARLRYAAVRYETEARLNQAIAHIYELQVRQSNISATRHHARSQRFFFGMLAAQAAVIIATFAIAARQRNLLWSLAAGVGLIAVFLAVYVYLFV